MLFATEEAKLKAIEELGDDPSKLSDLEEIRNAEIGVEPEVPVDENPPEPEKDPEPTEPPAEIPEETPAEPKVFTIKADELPEGYDTPGKAFKSLAEAQTYIKGKLSSIGDRTASEKEANARAEKAEAELSELRAAPGQKKETAADISDIQTEIKRVEDLQADLDKQADADPDNSFTADFQKKVRELSRLQTKNLNTLTDLYHKAASEIQDTRNAATKAVQDFESKANAGKQDEANEQIRKRIYDEVSNLDVPELKLSKRAEEVESDYLKFRKDVSLAFYGRPAQNTDEEFKALEQLQLKNPDLIQKCALIGLKSEPSEDVKRYIQNCEYLNFQNGWRKDPVTGKDMRLMRQDSDTGQMVPLVLPSLKAAIQQKRIEEGFYEKQVDGAFQKGAQSVAEAAQRRDKGAVELNTKEDQGQTQQGHEWAYKVLSETDAEEAMIEHRKGNNVKLEEINKARKILGQEPITFND